MNSTLSSYPANVYPDYRTTLDYSLFSALYSLFYSLYFPFAASSTLVVNTALTSTFGMASYF